MDDEAVIPDILEAEDPGEAEELSDDEAEFLLDEMEEFVGDVEAGAGDHDPAVREDMESLLSSFDAVAAPVALDLATLDQLASWMRVLVMEGEHAERGGPEEIRALIRQDLIELRNVLRRAQ